MPVTTTSNADVLPSRTALGPGWVATMTFLLLIAFALGKSLQSASWFVAMEHGDVATR
ncbi:MAG: hypothetical protein IPK60_10215 [Sandaracinaceae bacterium]|nr:hypothetical protein [Sandaracinaceae bacterium]